MFNLNKNHPMLGSDFAFNSYKKQGQTSNFRGTLIGIVVSFFILIFFSFFLNLAENYLDYGKYSQKDNKNIATEVKDILSFNTLLGIKIVNAATYARSDYKTLLMLAPKGELELAPGEEFTYKVGFKNNGNAIWYNNDTNFISIYTNEPKYRKSPFVSSSWYKYNQPAKLKQEKVLPGQLGFIEFKLKAPQTVGSYQESFYLAAEDRAWVEGGDFTISIKVINNKKVASTPIVSTTNNTVVSIPTVNQPVITNSNYGTTLLIASLKEIKATAGEVVDVRLGFKNTGKEPWDIKGILINGETLNSSGKSIFYNPTWTSGHQPALTGGIRTSAGELAFIDFKLRAPDVGGEYTAKLQLVVNYDKEVAGGDIEIPVYVTDQSNNSNNSGIINENINRVEPIVEIGLDYLTSNTEAVELTADKGYRITDKSGATLANLSANESIRIQYDFYTKIFSIKNARLNLISSGELHFDPIETNAIFTILSMSREGAYGHNYNKYRDGIILRQADTTGRLWIINRLPMEHYLWGIAETSNLSHIDYIKSIIVAARTYALYTYESNTKYGGYFHMRTTTADQLYQGYVSEIQRPRVVQAVNETKGEVITYNNKVVITPYYGHSDGRTRSWTEVWGGSDKPWLRSVSVPSDQGLELWGHGVGMSAQGAYHNAQTDGWNYTKILKYYYTGVEVSKVY